MSMKILIFLFNIPQYKQSVCENLPRNTYTNIVSYWIKWHGLLLQSWRGACFQNVYYFSGCGPGDLQLDWGPVG